MFSLLDTDTDIYSKDESNFETIENLIGEIFWEIFDKRDYDLGEIDKINSLSLKEKQVLIEEESCTKIVEHTNKIDF